MEVRYGGRRWAVGRDRILTFGRGAGNDVRIGADPEDLLVSRRAGRVRIDSEGVRVFNDSGSQELYLLPIPGREVPVGPGRSVGLSERYLRLVVLGRYGARYELVLDRRDVAPAGAGPARVTVPGIPTAEPPSWLTPAERRMLTALAEPLLSLAGPDARAATIEQVAERLDLSPAYVRRGLSDLRERLTTAEGVPRLRGEEPGPATRRFADQLADWAVRTRAVTPAMLGELPGR